jgi:hypothetical protein
MNRWFIYLNGKTVGSLNYDEADDEQDAKLNWADEYLSAKLEKVE